MDQQDQRYHLHHTLENSLLNSWGRCRPNQQQSGNGEKMLSSRAEKKQANTVPPCESGRSKGSRTSRGESRSHS
ncbi:unnamed protein product [Prunus armeniaca]